MIFLEFERSIEEVEGKIEELKSMASKGGVDIGGDIAALEKRLGEVRRDVYSRLTSWERTRVARHPERPHAADLIDLVFEDFVELHGDRLFGDDAAVIAGPALLEGREVMVIGQEKGRETRERAARNFGMPHPEGYRKANRLMRLAERFGRPVVLLIDTPGAYPGIGAEERGQASAIANSLEVMMRLAVPTIAVVIGEGGSGGALALGVADRVLMMENAVYSVISPEGCAAILFRDAARAPEAAEALKPTAPDLLALGLIDGIIPEPPGGAQRDPASAAREVRKAIIGALGEIEGMDDHITARYGKFRRMGVLGGMENP